MKIQLLFVILVNINFGDAVDISRLVSKLNYTEMISLIHGVRGIYTGNVNAIHRLGIPSLNMEDGPQGFRTSKYTGPQGTTTAWPCSLAVASTWNLNLVHLWAEAMAKEFKIKGANVFLGPGVGVARVPYNGRIFEYLSGEDPYLGAKLVKPFITSMQNQHVIACVKHFVNNEQEQNRRSVSSEVDERTRFEIYYPPFQAAVEAGVQAAMCSYNRINGVYACENKETIHDLRQTLNFSGWLMSDWLATHSTSRSILSGLDQELPIGILWSRESSQLWTNASHRALARELASQSIILLKNENHTLPLLPSLPLDNNNNKNNNKDKHDNNDNDDVEDVYTDRHGRIQGKGKSRGQSQSLRQTLSQRQRQGAVRILVVCDEIESTTGGGSGHVSASHIVTVKEALKEMETVITNTIIHTTTMTTSTSMLSVSYSSGKDIDETIIMAEAVDIVLVVIGVTSREAKDRSCLSLGDEQNLMVTALAAVHDNVIVVVRAPGAILLPWISLPTVKAVLLMFLPGQEAGHAVVDVLLGRVNPSGRLPLTIPNIENEIQFTRQQYPGTITDSDTDTAGVRKDHHDHRYQHQQQHQHYHYKRALYAEQLLVGYRWYTANNVKPLFPFGFGLSYSSFEYFNVTAVFGTGSSGRGDSALRAHLIPAVTHQASVVLMEVAVISVYVRNKGPYAGTDVVQLYISYPETCKEPPLQLRGFHSLFIPVGDTVAVSFSLTNRDLAIWDVDHHSWSVVGGVYGVYIGNSSESLHLYTNITVIDINRY
eukprot:gene3447-6851_t